MLEDDILNRITRLDEKLDSVLERILDIKDDHEKRITIVEKKQVKIDTITGGIAAVAGAILTGVVGWFFTWFNPKP